LRFSQSKRPTSFIAQKQFKKLISNPVFDASDKLRNSNEIKSDKRQRYRQNKKKREIALVKRLENLNKPNKNLDVNRPYDQFTTGITVV
jgi:hypothetical protein